jgi:hypothetical protein
MQQQDEDDKGDNNSHQHKGERLHKGERPLVLLLPEAQSTTHRGGRATGPWTKFVGLKPTYSIGV